MTTLTLPPETEITTLLTAALAQSGLTTEQAVTLDKAFSPIYAKAFEAAREVPTIAVKDATMLTEMRRARAKRLELRAIRVEADKMREAQKARALNEGRAVQACYNQLASFIEPLEARMLADETFAERAEAASKAKIKSEREGMLAPYGVDVSLVQCGEMTWAQWDEYFKGVKLAHQTKLDAAAKAEAERIAKEN